ncbi:TPA: Shiga toxin A subunit [Enterobacter asburiae]|nr:Shiga toxin A subunit [Enterobacter asburiae]
MLLTYIKNDLGIDLTTIQYDKTAVTVLSVAPVSDVFARKLAIADSQTDLKKAPDIRLSESEYYGMYHDSHVLAVTAKYTFTDKNGKRDEFISSAFANDDECSVRYNGYITLSREF